VQTLPAVPRGVSVARAWVYGGLAVGILDIADALVFWGLRGVAPQRIFRSIASGLLGAEARTGGPAVIVLGVLCHFVIAFTIAGIYLAASRRWTVLRRHPILCGALYGLAAYVVMQFVVLPLSAATVGSTQKGWPLVNGLFAHVFCVGIPAALAARKARPPEGATS